MELNSVAAGASGARGKSFQSIGQLAKMAVAQAREGGTDVSKGAQGIAASAIARGADMETVLARLIAAEPSAGDVPIVDAPVDESDAAVVSVETAGPDALQPPAVAVTPLPDVASENATVRGGPEPVPATTDAPLDALASSMAEDVARETLEMLFGQASTRTPG